jgi:hypothetical protein
MTSLEILRNVLQRHFAFMVLLLLPAAAFAQGPAPPSSTPTVVIGTKNYT